MSTIRPVDQPDLLIRGGHVIDPANGIDGVADVRIGGGRILAVAPSLPVVGAEPVIDAAGLLVTPGLIDMHAHCFNTHKRSRLSLEPRVNTFNCGVTTVVDAGTSGWQDFVDFRDEVIRPAKIRVLAYVNIVGKGMLGPWEHEVAEMNPRLAAAMVEANPDIAVGIKTAHYWTHQDFDAAHPAWAAVDAAVEAGNRCGKPVMVDFFPWLPDRPYPTLILEKLRPGDIHTHVFAQQFPIIDANGKVYDHMWKARERGIIFDVGHGAASFWFRNAAPAIEQGFVPDSISTDLHTGNVNGPVWDQLTTMNKILNLGVPVTEVIYRSTVTPAKEIGHPELGTLSPGTEADVALLRLETGEFTYIDCEKTTITGSQKLRCVMTLRAGETVWNPEGINLIPWQEGPRPVIPAY